MDQVLPPLALFRIPCPACESPPLSSPVPAKTTCPIESMASAPIANEACVSVSAPQLEPPSLLFHTPPPAVPAYTTDELVGSVTRLVTLPDAFPLLLDGLVTQHRASTMGV